jgi:hypothetical protein
MKQSVYEDLNDPQFALSRKFASVLGNSEALSGGGSPYGTIGSPELRK